MKFRRHSSGIELGELMNGVAEYVAIDDDDDDWPTDDEDIEERKRKQLEEEEAANITPESIAEKERLEEEDDQVLEHSSVNEGGHVPLEMEMSLLQPIGDDDMAEFERMEQHAQGQTDALISIPTNATVDADDMALLDQLEADLF